MVSLNRAVMQRSSRRMTGRLGPAIPDAAEIFGQFGNWFEFKSDAQFGYPYDICAGPFTSSATAAVQQFDTIPANQIWKPLDWLYAALAHVQQMLRPGGYFRVAVPLFISIHAALSANSRWSARGLKSLMAEARFDERQIAAQQRGNRAAAARNLGPDWPPTFNKATMIGPMILRCRFALGRWLGGAET